MINSRRYGVSQRKLGQPSSSYIACLCYKRILVAPPGLEPGLSALKGPRVNQLHHGAKTHKTFHLNHYKPLPSARAVNRRKETDLVALPGLEPGLSALRGRRVNQLHHNAKSLSAQEETILQALPEYSKGRTQTQAAKHSLSPAKAALKRTFYHLLPTCREPKPPDNRPAPLLTIEARPAALTPHQPYIWPADSITTHSSSLSKSPELTHLLRRLCAILRGGVAGSTCSPYSPSFFTSSL